ncbi:60S ribosomal protein L20 [Actinomortierella ambigua]|nr:60S ribosomal protein L20 [Actinomortierella ambigua]
MTSKDYDSASGNTSVPPSLSSSTYCERPLHEYQIVGRKLPSEKEPAPKLYRMRIFAPNDVVAKSRFWYYLRKLKKVKKVNGEVVAINQIHEKKPLQIKNFGIWIRYDSRSGTHNMYKEYRELTRVAAVESCYQDMASRHRARFSSVQIIRVAEVSNADVRRPYIKQLLVPNLKFPLPHRVIRAADKTHRALFMGSRPSTFY